MLAGRVAVELLAANGDDFVHVLRVRLGPTEFVLRVKHLCDRIEQQSSEFVDCTDQRESRASVVGREPVALTQNYRSRFADRPRHTNTEISTKEQYDTQRRDERADRTPCK